MADVVIKNASGNKVIYEGVEVVKLKTTDDGEQLYTKGVAVEDIPITLDFSEGDQTVAAGDNELMRSVVIKKPDTLTPENIRKDEVVAGITGTLEAGDQTAVDTLVASVLTKTLSGIYTNSVMTIVMSAAFSNFKSLTAVYLPEVSIVHSSHAFAYCTALTTVDLPKCTSIGGSAFMSCVRLSSVNSPLIANIGPYAFASCYIGLTEVNFPECTTVNNYAFGNCSKLTSVNLPKCMNIGDSAFYLCSSLNYINIPLCSSLGRNAFYNCTRLSEVYLPLLTVIPSNAFLSASLKSAIFPNCTLINSTAFGSNYYMKTGYFPKCSYIATYAFHRCSRLTSLYLFWSSVVSLPYSAAFSSTAFAYSNYNSNTYGSVFVPESLTESYKTATNWSYYSDRIVGLTDEEIAAITQEMEG